MVVWAWIKKYWKYLLAILGGCLAIAFYLMIEVWMKNNTNTDDGAEHVKTLGTVIGEIGSQLTEAKQQAAVETAVARSQEAHTKAELKVAVSEPDKKKRRKKLSELYDRV